MSKGPVKVSAEEAAKNQAFLASMAASGKERYIKRHSLQARLTHGITIAACILLCISGLFVFVPALAAAVGADTVFAIRMSHRIIGVVFVAVPLISALLAPKGVAHIFKNLFDRWDSDDKKWMMLFFPYLFMAKWIHMPDQREVKSGQRFADGMLWFAGALMGHHGHHPSAGHDAVRFRCGRARRDPVPARHRLSADRGVRPGAHLPGRRHLPAVPRHGEAHVRRRHGVRVRRPVPLGSLGPQGDRHGRERGGEDEVKARRPVRAAANRGGTGAGWVTRPDAPGLSS